MSGESKLPAWLHEARARLDLRNRIGPTEDWPRIPAVGEVRIASPAEVGLVDPRLVVVISVDPDRGFADVALCSNEIDLASTADVVMARGDSGLPFDVAIETDVVDRLWLHQLRGVVTRLDPEMTGIVRRAVDTGPDAIPLELKGPAIGTRAEGLLLFKSQEHRALRVLGGVAGLPSHEISEPAVLIDPALFTARAEEAEEDSVLRMLGLAEVLARTPTAAVPVDALRGFLEHSGWLDEAYIGHQDLDLYRSLVLLFERALADPSWSEPREMALHPPRRSASGVAEQELRLMLGSLEPSRVTSLKLVTDPEFWEGEFTGSYAMAEVGWADGSGPIQVVRQRLEAVS
jgi:hypothetical protein